MISILRNILIGVLIGLVLILVFDPHTRYNHDNYDEYAWYVYAPGKVVTVHFEHTVSMDGWSANETTGLEGERKVAEWLIGTEFFADYEIRMVGEHWALYRPESREENFSMRALYRITPWINE